MQTLLDEILKKLEARDLKELSYVLGMEVQRDREAKTLTISHKKIITDLLDRNKMLACRGSPTPVVPRENIISLSEDLTQEMKLVSDHKRFMKLLEASST